MRLSSHCPGPQTPLPLWHPPSVVERRVLSDPSQAVPRHPPEPFGRPGRADGDTCKHRLVFQSVLDLGPRGADCLCAV